MTWQGTKTWAPLEPGRSTDFNTYISDNLDYLLTRTAANSLINEGSDYTINSSTFAYIDTTDLAKTLTIQGTRALVLAVFSVVQADAARVYFDVTLDGVRQGGGDGLITVEPAGTTEPTCAVVMCPITGLTPNTSYTFAIQWKRQTGAGNSAIIYAGAGTSGLDVHPTFLVLEY